MRILDDSSLKTHSSPSHTLCGIDTLFFLFSPSCLSALSERNMALCPCSGSYLLFCAHYSTLICFLWVNCQYAISVLSGNHPQKRHSSCVKECSFPLHLPSNLVSMVGRVFLSSQIVKFRMTMYSQVHIASERQD